jgi:hypothetical protein
MTVLFGVNELVKQWETPIAPPASWDATGIGEWIRDQVARALGYYIDTPFLVMKAFSNLLPFLFVRGCELTAEWA